MKLYISDVEESYKDTIIGHLGNLRIEDLLLHIVYCWSLCAFDEDKLYLPMVLYRSGMIYKYYSLLGVFPIKHIEEGKDIHNEIFKNIPHFIKTVFTPIIFKMDFLYTRINYTFLK